MNPNPVMMVQEFLHQTVFLKKGRKLMLFVFKLTNNRNNLHNDYNQ